MKRRLWNENGERPDELACSWFGDQWYSGTCGRHLVGMDILSRIQPI